MALMLKLIKVTFGLYLIYFLTFLSGHPVWRPDPSAQKSEGLTEEQESLRQDSPSQDSPARDSLQNDSLPLAPFSLESLADESLADDHAQGGENSAEQFPGPISSGRMEWKSGSIERLWLLSVMLDKFEDPLVESDVRPETLLRLMNRQLSINSLITVATLFWCSLLAVALVISSRYWFYRPMSLILITISLFALLLQLLLLRRQEFYSLEAVTPYLFPYLYGRGLFELLLVLLGVAAFIKLLRYQPQHPKVFLDHLELPARNAGSRLKQFYTYSRDLVIIALIGTLAANLLLLPIYLLQSRYPFLFALLLVLSLLLLCLFYARSYMKTARLYNREASPLVSLSFLGFRMLQNTLFILLLCAGIASVLGAIFSLMLNNIHLLESVKIFVRLQSL